MTEPTTVDSDLAVVETVGDLSVVTTAEPSAPASSTDDDGGDVARDPDEIAQEIEQTRAELADTIDAIANRISPKKAAARGVQAVKSHVPGGVAEPADPALPTGSAAITPAVSSSPPVVPIAALAGLVVLVLLFVRQRRRR